MAILGIGVDVVEVERIQNALKNPRFRLRILTSSESAYCRTVQQVAGRWAAKEAISKALGGGLTWQQIEIVTSENGPRATIIDSRKLELKRLHVSISHEKFLASAIAVVESIEI